MSLPPSDHWERIHHVAIHVSDLEAAERRYCELFGMSVAFREGHDQDRYRKLPGEKPWSTVVSEVEEIVMSFCRRGGIVLGLESDDGSAGERGAIDHLSVRVAPETGERIRARAAEYDCTIEGEDPASVRMPEGVTWELYPRE